MSKRFDIAETPLAGLLRLERIRIGDARGWLERMFCADELRAAGWAGPIAQINRTLTLNRGTVRGMHFQKPPHEEAKLVSCLAGEVFDVAVDMRKNSPTYLRWHGEILSADNARSLLIPEGFAHGFQTLSEKVEMLYFHSAAYAPGAEDALRADDPALGISWPLAISEMSDRDRGHKLLSERT
ncbi:MAG: dTDP-4-dehydrorhamnose 3,5-epimerase family protein [Parvibaculum sp.]|uniref:dTDP-4-dehydrorhamnose 3,5-epimerase family protein n=1 Tax=Parvibaculum sp. TaxID=2024848 RepID=UPI0025CFC897|nr:dTDP-4-dehydrorhamnose 3,5-epimerase family protein [Parvibaculum sp.]MCE9650280.1 dTDP-4-dehydrorhamnose 3,5-epimerase family protein [Parvibaculum sp.]